MYNFFAKFISNYYFLFYKIELKYYYYYNDNNFAFFLDFGAKIYSHTYYYILVSIFIILSSGFCQTQIELPLALSIGF